MENIKEIKRDISNIFEILHDTDDTRFVINDDIREKYPKLMDYLFNNDFQVRDYYYEWGYEAIEQITEAIQEKQTIKEIIQTTEEIEFNIFADDYTSNITDWLNSNNENVYYLTEALEQDIQDGFDLLAEAQRIAKDEVFEGIRATILNLLNDL